MLQEDLLGAGQGPRGRDLCPPQRGWDSLLNTSLHCAFSWGFSPFCASGPLGGTQEPQDEGPTFRQRDGDGPGEASNLLPFPLVVSLTHQSEPAVNWAWSF